MTNPTAVPATARSAVAPVPRALDRSTDSVPSTTQNPCSTSVTSTTATARARPAAPRTAFRNHTEWKERCEANRRHSIREELAVDGPQSLVAHRLGTGSLEDGIGHQLSGDTQSSGPKARVQRPRRSRLPSGALAAPIGHRQSGSGSGQGGARRSSSSVLISWSSRRMESCSDVTSVGVVDRMTGAVADQRAHSWNVSATAS